MNKITTFILMCMAALIAAGTTARADTEFTYQGELKDNGGLANGSFNLDVTLWDALVGGNQIGSPLVLNGVPVTEGRFAVELDFGPAAFDNSGRWLEIAVEGVTLSPRHPITRSPYSIQTRGIYVAENENVGIGTTNPQHLLHVVGDTNAANAIYGYSTELSNTAAGVYGQSASSNGYGVYGYASALTGSNYGVFGKTNGAFGTGVFAHATHNLGQTYGVYSLSQSNSGTGVYGEASSLTGNTYGVWGKTRSPNGFAGYFEGQGYFSDNVGFGTQSPVAGQLTIAASGAGTIHAIEATSDTTVFPTIFAQNTANNGSVLWAIGDSDVTPSAGGIIVAGDQAAKNIAIDGDEIMARDAGQPSTLHLNAEGGQVNMGQHNIHPALAYGKVFEDGSLISGSSNIISVVRIGEGSYDIDIEGEFLGSDITLATASDGSSAGAALYVFTTRRLMRVVTQDDGESSDSSFSFVVYRQ